MTDDTIPRDNKPEPERETYEVAILTDFGRGYQLHLIGDGDKWLLLNTADHDTALLTMLRAGWMLVGIVPYDAGGHAYYFQRKAVSND